MDTASIAVRWLFDVARVPSMTLRLCPISLLVLFAVMLSGLSVRDALADEPERSAWAERSLEDLDNDGIIELLEELHARYPRATELHVLGTSVRGRPIVALALGSNLAARRDRPAVLLEGGIHGDERLVPAFVLDAALWLLEHQDDPEVARWLDETVIWCVPLLNPDGRTARLERSRSMGRKNARDTNGNGHWDTRDGVDLNRNFPFAWGETRAGSRDKRSHVWYRGPKPASEPETRALIALARSEHFVASVSFHMGATGLLVPYSSDAYGELAAPEAWAIARELVERSQRSPWPIEHALKRNLYPVDGGDHDWLHATFGTTALLLEAGVVTPVEPPERLALIERNRGVWQELLRRTVDGPSLSVVVVDRAGNPVSASLELQEAPLEPFETWLTRCRDGRFDRLVATPGAFTLRVTPSDGRAPVAVPIEIAATGRTEVEVRITEHSDVPRAACQGPDGWTEVIARGALDDDSAAPATGADTTPPPPADLTPAYAPRPEVSDHEPVVITGERFDDRPNAPRAPVPLVLVLLAALALGRTALAPHRRRRSTS